MLGPLENSTEREREWGGEGIAAWQIIFGGHGTKERREVTETTAKGKPYQV